MNLSCRAFVGLLALVVIGCSPSPSGDAGGSSAAKHPPAKELGIKDTKVGTGTEAKTGDAVEMIYTGELANGSVFDSNDKPDGQPFHFVLGKGAVIKGWDQGIVGMKVGGERELAIPSSLAYGDKDQGKIPPNSDLYFTVKLLGVVPKGDEGNFDHPKDTTPGTGRTVADYDWVKITYRAEYLNGKLYAESGDKNPIEYQTVSGLTPKGDIMGVVGLRYALKGMKVGGTREIVLPPLIAYPTSVHMGEKGPPQLIIKYIVKLLSARPGTKPADK